MQFSYMYYIFPFSLKSQRTHCSATHAHMYADVPGAARDGCRAVRDGVQPAVA